MPDLLSSMDLGQTTRCGAAQEIHLPQPVLSHAEPERGIGVALVLGMDVRHPVPISYHSRLAAERRDLVTRIG